MSIIRVDVEAEPSPEGRGAFRIAQRIEKSVWEKMKSSAWHLCEDDLEDMDMFNVDPGWRYSLDALYVLLSTGSQIEIYSEIVTTPEGILALFTPEAKQARLLRAKQEAEEAARAQRLAEVEAWHERTAAGAAYALWVEEITSGFARTTIAPPAGGDWALINCVAVGTPGSWYSTGDAWYRSADGVLRKDYGNAVVYFARQSEIDAWVLAKDDGSVRYARHVLVYHGYGVFGSDVADRLVELNGIEHYIERACREPWFFIAKNVSSRERDAAAHYGAPCAAVKLLPYDYKFVQRMAALLGLATHNPSCPRAAGQTADGRWWTTTDSINGGNWRSLSDEHAMALGLSLSPPVPAPELPPARPLSNELSRRFSEMFTA